MIKKEKIKLICIFSCLFFAITGFSATFTDQIQQLVDDDFSAISDEQLISYFIYVSGDSAYYDEIFSDYLEKATEIDGKMIEKMISQQHFSDNPTLQSDFLLQEMHRSFFSKYDFYSFTASALKNKGFYNCVSSSILYAALLLRHGITEIIPIETPDHVFISLEIDGKQIDVETTNRLGFDPGTKKEFKDNFGKTTGFSYVPPSNYSLRQKISLKQLISLVSHNRATHYNTRKDYVHAFEQAEIVKQVRKDEKGDTDYDGTLINLINNTIQKKDYTTAKNLLFEKLAPTNPRYIRLYDAILFGIIDEQYKAGLYGSAFDKVTKITSPDIRHAAVNNICTEIVRLAQRNQDYRTGISILELAESYGLSDSLEYKKNRYILINNLCVQYIKNNQFDDAKAIMYTEWERNIVVKSDLQKIFKGIIVSEAHYHLQEKRYEKTIASTKEGLMYLPNDALLMENLRTAYSQYLLYLSQTDENLFNRITLEAQRIFPNERRFQ